MGQAAFKYDEFEDLDRVPIPEGGIATFLTARTGSWADEEDEIPKKGITNVVKIADKLAKYGRNEDEYMVHAAEGETVIPMEVFKQNPALKDKLFAEMRIMGIEPERYIVGNELNSINPVTGQPEFFLKKLFKGLKKVVKAVLPVVATIGLSMMGVPPAVASAIVSGAQTAIEGGSFKDSLKAAAIGGISSFAAGRIGNRFNWAQNSAKQMATQAAINTTLSGGKPRDILKSAATSALVAKGMQRAFGGPKEFEGPQPGEELSEMVGAKLDTALEPDLRVMGDTLDARAANAVSDTVIDASNPAPAVPSEVAAVPPAVDAAAIDATQPVAQQDAGAVLADTDIAPEGAVLADTDIAPGSVDLAVDAGSAPQTVINMDAALPSLAEGADTTTVTGQDGQAALTIDDLRAPKGSGEFGVFESVKDVFTGTGDPDAFLGGRVDALRNLFMPRGQVDRANVKAFLKAEGQPFDNKAIDSFIKNDLELGTFRTYGPGAAALLATMALSPGEDVALTDLSTLPTGFDLIEENPQAYRIFQDNQPISFPTFAVTRAAGNYEPTPLPTNVATGGEITNFPRMNGPIEGPGTETSDDIPAMLSDGEFVFTAKAVRGAGRGSREDGMRNMYRMMRQFESRV